MRVCLDCRMIDRSGIGRYLSGLLEGLSRVGCDIDLILAGRLSAIEDCVEHDDHLADVIAKCIRFESPLYGVDCHLRGSLIMRSVDAQVDLFHFPHYNVPWFTPAKSVVTIHDMTHFRMPEVFGTVRTRLAGLVMRNSIEKAIRIITVSSATAIELTKFWPQAEPKIVVIHNGVSDRFLPIPEYEVSSYKRTMGLGRYILYVGNRKPHKNLPGLLKAFKQLKHMTPDLQLVIAGAPAVLHDDTPRTIRELRLDGVVEFNDPSDDDLLHLYCGSEVLVQPSLEEGFGLTALEAMACGTPIAVSRIPPLEEVAGYAASYFDPYRPDSIADAIYRLISNDALSYEMGLKGKARSRLFTWEECAKRTLSVYQESVSRSGRT